MNVLKLVLETRVLHNTRLERHAKDKHSSLFGPFISYEKMKCLLGPFISYEKMKCREYDPSFRF